MEKRKPGRPKSNLPTRNKNINFRVTLDELEKAIRICNFHNIRYVDVFLKGLENWTDPKKQ